MHKKLIKKGGVKSTPKLQSGGWFSRLNNSGFGKSAGSLAAGLTSGNAAIPGALGMTGQPLSEGQLLNQSIGAGLSGAFTGLIGLSNIKNNQGLNSDQKRIATGDMFADTASQVAGAFGPVGQGIGAGLNIVNKLGGMIMGTPKVLKDFKINDQVASSSAYTGIADSAMEMGESANSYKNAGLFGKLFGGKKKLVNKANMNNAMQLQTNNLLNQNNKQRDAILAGSEIGAIRNTNRLTNGDMWTTGAVMYGQKGGTLIKGDGSMLGDLGAIILNKIQSNKSDSKLKKFRDKGKVITTDIAQIMDPTGVTNYGDVYDDIKNGAPFSKTALDIAASLPVFGKLPKLGKKLPLAYNAVGHILTNFSDYSKLGTDTGILKKNVKGGKLDRIAKASVNIKKLKTAPIVKVEPIESIDIEEIEVEEVVVPEFKDGGTINVIVDGALHAHKHDIKLVGGFEDANITLKGVPVITQSEGGEIKQHAEVERDELVLHLSLTKKLEMLLDEGDDEAMIQAGRLLAKELIKNTKDSKNKIIKNG